jgi:hypothetical protein
MNITDLIQGQLSGDLINQLTNKIGAKNSEQTATAASSIMNVLLGAMAQNAAKPEGAAALNNALERDHDGSVLDNLMGMFTGQAQPANSKAINGAGILGHILGSRQSGAVEAVSKASGLNTNQVGSLMVSLAPMIMGMLGKVKKEEGLDSSGLAGMLGGLMANMKGGNQSQTDPKMALLMSFLDQNKDGNIADDVMRMGGGLLGKLFGKK